MRAGVKGRRLSSAWHFLLELQIGFRCQTVSRFDEIRVYQIPSSQLLSQYLARIRPQPMAIFLHVVLIHQLDCSRSGIAFAMRQTNVKRRFRFDSFG